MIPWTLRICNCHVHRVRCWHSGHSECSIAQTAEVAAGSDVDDVEPGVICAEWHVMSAEDFRREFVVDCCLDCGDLIVKNWRDGTSIHECCAACLAFARIGTGKILVEEIADFETPGDLVNMIFSGAEGIDVCLDKNIVGWVVVRSNLISVLSEFKSHSFAILSLFKDVRIPFAIDAIDIFVLSVGTNGNAESEIKLMIVGSSPSGKESVSWIATVAAAAHVEDVRPSTKFSVVIALDINGGSEVLCCFDSSKIVLNRWICSAGINERRTGGLPVAGISSVNTFFYRDIIE